MILRLAMAMLEVSRGMSCRKAADFVGLDRGTILRHAQKIGLPVRSGKSLQDKINEAVNYVTNGTSFTQAAFIVGINKTTVARHAKKMGVKPFSKKVSPIIEAKIAKAIDALSQGANCREAATLAGLSRKTVLKYAHIRGITLRSPGGQPGFRWPKPAFASARVIELYRKEIPNVIIAARLGKTPSAVGKIVRRWLGSEATSNELE